MSRSHPFYLEWFLTGLRDTELTEAGVRVVVQIEYPPLFVRIVLMWFQLLDYKPEQDENNERSPRWNYIPLSMS